MRRRETVKRTASGRPGDKFRSPPRHVDHHTKPTRRNSSVTKRHSLTSVGFRSRKGESGKGEEVHGRVGESGGEHRGGKDTERHVHYQYK